MNMSARRKRNHCVPGIFFSHFVSRKRFPRIARTIYFFLQRTVCIRWHRRCQSVSRESTPYLSASSANKLKMNVVSVAAKRTKLNPPKHLEHENDSIKRWKKRKMRSKMRSQMRRCSCAHFQKFLSIVVVSPSMVLVLLHIRFAYSRWDTRRREQRSCNSILCVFSKYSAMEKESEVCSVSSVNWCGTCL